MPTAWKDFMFAVQGALLFLLILVATELALGQTAPADELPTSARILAVQTGGSGCEATQTAVSLAPDLQSLSLLFSNFNLELGAGTAQPEASLLQKNCRIQVEIETPPGWSMAIKSVDYRGYARLPEGATARHRFSYRTEGMPPAMLREAPLRGPLDQDYFFRLEQPLSERRHTPCGPPNIRLVLNTHMSLRLGRERDTALLSLDSADMTLHQDFQIEWKRCGRNRR